MTSLRKIELSCPICGKALSGRRMPGVTTCGSWHCRHKALASKRNESDEMRSAKHNRHEQKMRDATAERDRCESKLDKDKFQVIVTPTNERPIKRVPRPRKYRFANLIVNTVESAFSKTSSPVATSPETMPLSQDATGGDDGQGDDGQGDDGQGFSLPVFGSVCGNCKGQCCVRGGNRAYISESTINRIRAARPDADARQIIDDYCSHIPESIYEASCIFHTEKGCALPAEMRSDTCNNTVCGGLVELQQRIHLDSQSKFFVAGCNDDGVQRTKWIDVDQSE